MKVITICGSLRFKDEIMKIAEWIELNGNVVLTPIIPIKETYTESELAMLGKMHEEKIKLSDVILVMNVNNYIGNSTQSEIRLAKALNKEILYYTDLPDSMRDHS